MRVEAGSADLEAGPRAPAQSPDGRVEIQVRGRPVLVPMQRVNEREVITTGRWLKVAELRDEEWLEGNIDGDPVPFIAALKNSGLIADLFVFSGSMDSPSCHPEIYREKENTAAIRTDEFKAWWDSLPQSTRRNKRRAERMGIRVREVQFDAAFADGIKAIYDETPLRQGRRFWHYGKNIDSVKAENETYAERSVFLGAYLEGQLVGFLKFVRVGNAGRIMQILCMNAHQDKRPIFALIERAAELCHKQGAKYLTYGRMVYGNKADSSVVEFKKRLGFGQIDHPKYVVPLTTRGRLCLALGLHKGIAARLPPRLIERLLKVRSWWIRQTTRA